LLNTGLIDDTPNLAFFLDGITLIDEVHHKAAPSRNAFLVIFMDAILRLALKEHFQETFPTGPSQSTATIASKLDLLGVSIKTLVTLKALIETRAQIDFDIQSTQVTTEEIETYRSAIQAALRKMFRLKFPLRTQKQKKG
jgi:hypothetical protein